MTGAILVQLALGGAYRHAGMGVVPHIVGAAVVTLLVAWVVSRILTHFAQQPALARPALLLGGLLMAQIVLGVESYMLKMAARGAPQPLPPVVRHHDDACGGGRTDAGDESVSHLPDASLSGASERSNGDCFRASSSNHMKQEKNNSQFTAAAPRQAARPAWLAHLADYWTLTKPEVNFLVLVSALVGFYLAAPGAVQGWLLFHTLLGTLLVASGTGTLNQYIERRTDACMRRTANRPLPAGRLAPAAALWFGILISIAGGAELWVAANPLTSALALATLVTYLALYTPLKRRTPLCTVVGAFPGAMPPLIGWAAVRNGLNAEAWVLYAILFLWQFPHLLAIA